MNKALFGDTDMIFLVYIISMKMYVHICLLYDNILAILPFILLVTEYL